MDLSTRSVCVMTEELGTPKDFYVSYFMKGLKEEIQAPVQLFRPRNLTAAMGQARLLENSLEIWSRKI